MSRYKLDGEDVAGFSRDSKDIIFDKTGTNFTSDDVDGVLREIDGDLTDLLYFKSFSFSIYGDGSHYYASGSTDITVEGYTPKMCSNANSNRDNIIVRSCYISGNTLNALIANTQETIIATTTKTDVSATVLYIKSA